ncbi:MAG: protein kinase [Gemmataceae bacterium]|nr:protein kinase [Gemmataceae bacterium]
MEASDGLGKAFALKVIKNHPEFIGCLDREMRRLAELETIRSDSLVEIYAVEPKYRCIRMELLLGCSLRELLPLGGGRRIFSPLKLVHIGLEVAEALSQIHALGVNHRGIKPENIFLARKEGRQRAVLLDFGVASRSDGPITSLGGTAVYSPPEEDHRRQGRTAQQSNDLYALGKVLFEMLSGKVPGAGVHNIEQYQTPYPAIRDLAWQMFYDDRKKRYFESNAVAEKLRELASSTLPGQLPTILDEALSIVRRLAEQILNVDEKGDVHSRALLTNIKLDDNQQAELGPRTDDWLDNPNEVDDVFDLGQTLYALVVGGLPHDGESYSDFALSRNLRLMTQFLNTIETMCAEPAFRPSMSAVVDRLYTLQRFFAEGKNRT